MSKQTINIGASPNDGTGTPLRTSFDYTNQNFTELYTAVGPSGNNIVVPGNAAITGDLTVDTNVLKVDTTNNRVGVVQATPLYPLHLVGEFGLESSSGDGAKLRLIGSASHYNFRLGKQLTLTNTFEITPSTAAGGSTFSNPVYTVTYDGIHTFLDGAGGTRMTLNSTGLGIGASPSNYRLYVSAAFASGLNGAYIESGEYNKKSLVVNHTNSGVAVNLFEVQKVGTALLTLDASGNLLVGTTSGSFGSRLVISADAGTTKWATGPLGAGPTNYYITANNTQGVFLNGTTATAWTAISDERFKDIIEPISNAIAKVGLLRSVIGKFKTDDEGTRRAFLIAQDVLAAFPEAAVATNPDKLAVTYTEVIPLLVAAIKELTARVQTLEAR